MRRGAKPGKAKVETRLSVARKAPKNEASGRRELKKRLALSLEREKATGEILQEKDRALAEALEQQTATSEILRVISSSPTELQPAMDAIAESAARVCGANDAVILMGDGDNLRAVAHHGSIPMAQPVGQVVNRINRESAAGRAIVDRQTVHVSDLAAPEAQAEFPLSRDLRRAGGHRTILATPLLREGSAIGAIILRRLEVRPFTERQISLLETFADQAVIAIENVRLFNETKEALERQTATSEILSVISSSPTDIQPVLDAVAQSATRLCDAYDAWVGRLDGDVLRVVAHHGLIAVPPGDMLPVIRGTVAGRTVIDGRTVHVIDLQEAMDEYPEGSDLARRLGFRTSLCVPLLREGVPIGVIHIRRSEVRPFTDNQIALLQTFADQAVIAIENVRLFKELEARNRDLTATSEILRVISRSPTDAQPVFDTIAELAMRLCDGAYGWVTAYDGEWIHLRALANVSPEGTDALRQVFPVAPSRGSTIGRSILTEDIVQIPDVLDDREYEFTGIAQAVNYRSAVAVPMFHQGRVVGVIAVSRPRPGNFSPEQIQLLKAFADQAVIAIENVRLFQEVETRTRELTRSVDRLTALGDVGRAVSSSLDLGQVLTTIVSRAVQLSGMDAGAIYEYDKTAEVFHLRATEGLPDEFLESAPLLRKGEGVTGQLAVTRAPVQIPDISVPGAYQSRARDVLLNLGLRAAFAVPLLHEGRVVGGLAVNRKMPGEFSQDIVELLQTFATQSALAIQNARLFREIEEKGRQLEAASRHKSEFLANMSHELRTPLNAIIGFSEVLTERMFGELNEKQAEYLKDICASGQHLLSLINDILDLSKIEAGRMELETTDFDLPSAIDNALILVRGRASRRGVTLGCTIDEHLGMLRGDERKVKQVLLNLLSNALKFTPEGGRIDVSAGVHDDVAELSVTDTGVGIAPEDQEAVFEEFRQVGTADKKVEGTGLGLTLSRKFIELHGGRIWVKSAVGVGSTFTFTLPLRG